MLFVLFVRKSWVTLYSRSCYWWTRILS